MCGVLSAVRLQTHSETSRYSQVHKFGVSQLHVEYECLLHGDVYVLLELSQHPV